MRAAVNCVRSVLALYGSNIDPRVPDRYDSWSSLAKHRPGVPKHRPEVLESLPKEQQWVRSTC